MTKNQVHFIYDCSMNVIHGMFIILFITFPLMVFGISNDHNLLITVFSIFTSIEIRYYTNHKPNLISGIIRIYHWIGRKCTFRIRY